MRINGKTASAAVLLACCLAAPPGAATASDTSHFEIEAMPLAEALASFARQAGISIGRPPLSYRDGKAHALNGDLTVEEGLTQLLQGTGFTFEVVSPSVVRVFREPAREKTAPKPATKAQSEPFVQEIMVSSLRRTDNLQKLPYGISAIGASTQQQLGLKTTNAAARRIAGMHATTQGDGQNKVMVRGLSDGAFSGRAQSLVSTYFDNTRLTYNAPDPSLRLVDVERIEVLRGPQGTLYGSGALTGLYRVVTKKPNLAETELSTSAGLAWTKGGTASRDISGIVNVPLVEDQMAIRAAAYFEHEGGYIDDLRLGLDNVNQADTYGGRLSAHLNLGPNWHLLAGVTLQENDRDDSNYYDVGRTFTKRGNYVQEPREDSFSQVYATLGADYGWGTLETTFSWTDRNIDATFDGSLAVPKLVLIDVVASPFTMNRDIATTSNETHLSSKTGGRLEWTIGSFWSKRNERINSNLAIPASVIWPDEEGDLDIYTEDLTSTLKEAALFGEVTYFLTEKLAVTGGFRWFDYRERASSDLVDLGLFLFAQTDGEQKKSGVTPKAVLAYHHTKDLMLYAQVAEGYRLGGINLAGPTPIGGGETVATELTNYKSDALTNYEVGYKYQSPDKALTTSAAVYVALWRRIQSQQFSFEGLPDIDNVGNARVIGAEFELAYRPAYDFEVRAHLSASDSELTDTTARFGAEVGTPLPAAPKFSAGASVYKEFSLSNDLRASVSADYSYEGGADLLFESDFSPEMDGYHLVNARLSLQKNNWSLTVYGNNLIGDKSNVFAFGNPLSLEVIEGEDPDDPNFVIVSTGLHATPLRPRTFGVELGWRF
ncbi:TonB-dependent receptor domain-containing protein [Kordiimonas lacus]|uniref:Outer membrane receptor proteins, mostly Fe transport n=1 Tax=Kordiimonas lacus TaxID=637679 RepID=A0A1G7A590_9PROT|nr:TonB-dependent receptor [Kordiimonas lacus]SDE09930.1 Outer membrane receptor proteins, mostly Fe transport [Kordiimonas lacus]